MSIDRHDRKTPTTLDKLRVIVRQALCPLCNKKLGALEDTQFDHAWALVNGGDNDLSNLRAVHVECHKIKTHGNGATNRGSDRGEAAKTRRLVEKRERREAEAAVRITELNGDSAIDELPKCAKIKSKPKSRIRSANRWPPKKVRPPYRRKGV